MGKVSYRVTGLQFNGRAYDDMMSDPENWRIDELNQRQSCMEFEIRSPHELVHKITRCAHCFRGKRGKCKCDIALEEEVASRKKIKR